MFYYPAGANVWRPKFKLPARLESATTGGRFLVHILYWDQQGKWTAGMDVYAVDDAIIPVDPGKESKNADLLKGISSIDGAMREMGNVGEVLTRVELDLAYSSEKLVNLNILMMQVTAKESDFETFLSEQEHGLADSVEQALEFNLLSGILDSEVGELDNFMADIHSDIISARDEIYSCECLGEIFTEMKEKLRDSEESLEESQGQISEMRLQTIKFQRTMLSFVGEENRNHDKDVDALQDGQSSDVYPKIKMQTAEQQRRILRMLEKSLAKELDLDKKLMESKLIEEELKLRLHSSEQEVFYLEEEAAVVCERLFESDNVAEVLMGILKELMGRLQICQFNLNGSSQREAELKSHLQTTVEQLKAKESAFQKLESCTTELHYFLLEQTNRLKACSNSESPVQSAKAYLDGSQQLHNILDNDASELENVINVVKEKISDTESRFESAEAGCKLLTEANMKLNVELDLIKKSGSSEKVDSLERQLKESNIQLQHAVASAEASQEKQSLLYSSIRDMENVIEKLKLKVSKAECQTDSAEEKCIMLSESNAELIEELGFMRSKMESLEISLHQAEETKMETAKGVGVQAKVITDLVMQLAIERERLHQQISLLAKENNILAHKLRQTSKDPSTDTRGDGGRYETGFLHTEKDLISTTSAKDSKVPGFLTAEVEVEETAKNTSLDDTDIGPVDPASKLKTVRTIDAGLLNFKHVFGAILVLLISVAVYLFQQEI